FTTLAASMGLGVPDRHRITDPQQVIDFDWADHGAGHGSGTGAGRTYILKSLAYDPVRRMDLTELPRPTPAETAAFVRSLPISPDNPWILQEFVRGQEYCTHATVRDGDVQLHCCCPSSGFQINYEMVDDPEIEAWVRTFVGELRLTGQVSFDFIRSDDGRLMAIECNPRTHSAITMFYDHPGVARAYLDAGVPTVYPTRASRPTYWLYHEIWRILRRPSSIAERLGVLARGKDAIFDMTDPLPFLLVHHLQIPALLLDTVRRGTEWVRIDFNIGKLIEPAGD
ncbi:MAG: ATP-grasp enzyme, partial [Pseudonocardia sediminis]